MSDLQFYQKYYKSSTSPWTPGELRRLQVVRRIGYSQWGQDQAATSQELLKDGANVLLRGCYFRENFAINSGGAAYVSFRDLSVSPPLTAIADCVFEGNGAQAVGWGAPYYIIIIYIMQPYSVTLVP